MTVPARIQPARSLLRQVTGEVGESGPDNPARRAVTWWTIFAVCDELAISPIDLVSEDRHAPLPLARKLVAWTLKNRGFSPGETGRIIGRSEATVRYYLRNMERRRRGSWETIALCSRIRLRVDNPTISK